MRKLKNSIIYHCGPLVIKQGKNYKIISAGPTTSSRLSIYLPKLIKKLGIKTIIGKGGLNKEAALAMKKYECVYLSAIGGAGALLASSIKKVKNVYKSEFGATDAIYELKVENFPCIVTVDTKGKNLYNNVFKESRKVYNKLV